MRLRVALLILLGSFILIGGQAFGEYRGCPPFEAKNQSTLIDFRIDGSVPSSWIPAILRAAETWNEALEEVGAEIRFNTSPSFASQNVISAEHLGKDESPAQANSPSPARPCYGPDGQPLGLCLVFNLDKKFVVAEKRSRALLVINDVQGIATHEFGHWLGFLDVWVRCSSVMRQFINTFDNRKLTQNDKEALREIYGSPKTKDKKPKKDGVDVLLGEWDVTAEGMEECRVDPKCIDPRVVWRFSLERGRLTLTEFLYNAGFPEDWRCEKILQPTFDSASRTVRVFNKITCFIQNIADMEYTSEYVGQLSKDGTTITGTVDFSCRSLLGHPTGCPTGVEVSWFQAVKLSNVR